MGYEIKMYIITESSLNSEKLLAIKDGLGTNVRSDDNGLYHYGLDGNTKTYLAPDEVTRVRELAYSKVLCMVDLAKPGYSSAIRELASDSPTTTHYFYGDDGNLCHMLDQYGEPLKETSLASVIEALAEDIDESDYRRYKTALGVLKSVDPDDYKEGVKVLFYGY